MNDPGFSPLADGKGEKGINRSFERTGTPMCLEEKSSPLERGEQIHGAVVRVCGAIHHFIAK
jgi:hypothetical protein